MSGERGTVLVVEDSPEQAALFSALVQREAFQPLICPTAAAAASAIARSRPVAILLDWVLPDGPGIELCRQVRAKDQTVVIIFVSGRKDETSIARGLDAGADDYIAKPVREGELIARLEAHLRRVTSLRASAMAVGQPPEPSQRIARFGDVEVDFVAHEARVAGSPVRLGPLEFKLLEYLSRNAGVAVSRDQILTEVYGYDADIGTERVDLLVRRLRAKLGHGPDSEGHLVAVPGYGYRLERRLQATD